MEIKRFLGNLVIVINFNRPVKSDNYDNKTRAGVPPTLVKHKSGHLTTSLRPMKCRLEDQCSGLLEPSFKKTFQTEIRAPCFTKHP